MPPARATGRSSTRRAARDRRAARAPARAAHHALRAHPHRRPTAPAAAGAIDADARSTLRCDASVPPRAPVAARRGTAARADEPTLDVVGIGNALVDVLSHETDEFLAEHGLEPGAMTLIDAERGRGAVRGDGPGDRDLRRLGGQHDWSGSRRSAAPAAFVGRVGDDAARRRVRATTSAPPASSSTRRPRPDGAPTGRCLIIVTPDAAAHDEHLPRRVGRARPADVDARPRRRARRSLYLEGYLWDEPDAKEAFRHAAPHRARRRATGSRSRCPTRSASTATATSSSTWSSTRSTCCSPTRPRSRRSTRSTTFDDALQRGRSTTARSPRSPAARRARWSSPATRCTWSTRTRSTQVVDTTGAGDLYAAGFLYGLTHGYDLGTAGRLGALAAAEVIATSAPGPRSSLAELAAAVAAGLRACGR